MSKRRKIGDIVVLDDEDGAPPYLGRIDALGAEPVEPCPHRFLEAGHDPDCIEWANIQVLDQNLQPTGEWEHHVPECQLDDPA